MASSVGWIDSVNRIDAIKPTYSISPADLVWLDKARANARKSCARNYRVGAVLVERHQQMAVGQNIPRARAKPFGWLHAETVAIARLKERLNRGHVFVVVLCRSGRDAVSWPCIRCQTALREAGVEWMTVSVRGKAETRRLRRQDG